MNFSRQTQWLVELFVVFLLGSNGLIIEICMDLFMMDPCGF